MKKKRHVRLTTAPVKPFSYKKCGKYRSFSRLKSFDFSVKISVILTEKTQTNQNISFIFDRTCYSINEIKLTESEFDEFEPRLKSDKNRFQMSAGLNLKKLEYNFNKLIKFQLGRFLFIFRSPAQLLFYKIHKIIMMMIWFL